MMYPLVSVIIPVYNSELWLEECLESVLCQSYKNIEVILIDDNSTDDSYNICVSFANRDERIQYYKNTMKGVSSARNLGIRKASGVYLTFVDSDDLIEKDYIKELVNGMQYAELSLCGIRLQDESYRIEQEFIIENQCYPKDKFVENIIIKIPFILVSAACCKCYKREIIVNEHVSFQEDVSIGEDCLFNIDYICKCKNISTVSYVGYLYKKRNCDSLTNRVHPEIFVAQTRILKKFLDLYLICDLSEQSKSVFINAWVEQVCGAIINACRKNIRQDVFLEIVNPLRIDLVQNIDLSFISGIKQKIMMILIKAKAFKIMYILLRWYR